MTTEPADDPADPAVVDEHQATNDVLETVALVPADVAEMLEQLEDIFTHVQTALGVVGAMRLDRLLSGDVGAEIADDSQCGQQQVQAAGRAGHRAPITCLPLPGGRRRIAAATPTCPNSPGR